jgi:hypothetical protein
MAWLIRTDIRERYDEKFDEDSNLYVYLEIIVIKDGTVYLTLQQNYPIWNADNNAYQWERVTVKYTYIYDKDFKGDYSKQ